MALRPVAFLSQNAAFTPDPAPAHTDDFRDPTWGTIVDFPYRMGAGTYSAVDPGESYVQVGTQNLAVGVSTASEQWGPADRFPLLLGTEAGGFPRAYLQGSDLPVGIGRLQGRWLFGVLETSPEAGLADTERKRIASALVMTFSPAAFPGLEIGGGRFFHVRMTPGTIPWSSATWPFAGLLKNRTEADPTGAANQLASVFARLSPGAGVAVYGEYLREDHNTNLRDLALEPDHIAAYAVGLRRAWRIDSDVVALTMEHANGRISHLERVRSQSPIYTHGILLEGHTYKGQPLGSSALIGGGGSYLALDRVGAQRTYHTEIEILAGPQSGEGGTWHGKLYAQQRIGASAEWKWNERWIGGGATLGFAQGGGALVNLTLAARLR